MYPQKLLMLPVWKYQGKPVEGNRGGYNFNNWGFWVGWGFVRGAKVGKRRRFGLKTELNH